MVGVLSWKYLGSVGNGSRSNLLNVMTLYLAREDYDKLHILVLSSHLPSLPTTSLHC